MENRKTEITWEDLFDQVLSSHIQTLYYQRKLYHSATNKEVKRNHYRFPQNFLQISKEEFVNNSKFLSENDYGIGKKLFEEIYDYLHLRLKERIKHDKRVQVQKITDPKRGALVEQDGLFASSMIPKSTIICEYGGYVDLESNLQHLISQLNKPDSDEKTLLISCTKEWPELIGNDGNQNSILIDGYFHENLGSKLNDYRQNPYESEKTQKRIEKSRRREPNCMFCEVMIFNWPHIFIVTKSDIFQGEELCIDYGSDFWQTIRFHTFLKSFALNSKTNDGHFQINTFFDLLSKL